jgi:hypothetical protein
VAPRLTRARPAGTFEFDEPVYAGSSVALIPATFGCCVVGVERASTVAGIVITATLVVGTGTAIGIVVAGAVGGDVGAGVGVGIGGKSSDGSTVVDVVDVVGEFVA